MPLVEFRRDARILAQGVSLETKGAHALTYPSGGDRALTLPPLRGSGFWGSFGTPNSRPGLHAFAPIGAADVDDARCSQGEYPDCILQGDARILAQDASLGASGPHELTNPNGVTGR